MNFESYLNQDWANNVVVPVALTLLAIATILAINWGKIRTRWLEWHSHRGLDKIGIKQIKNAICADGLDGKFEIDRLVMLHGSILVIAFRPYSGNIYCAESIPEWTQLLDQKSYKFKNPLFELGNQVSAIQNYLPGVSIRGVLIFDYSASFPKGHPERVMRLDNIPESLLHANCPEPRPEVLKGWDALLKLPLRREQEPLYQ
ncbi:MAG: nuclease-related domain-containing protein [Gammaproteobacteria bacterium]